MTTVGVDWSKTSRPIIIIKVYTFLTDELS